MQENVKDIKVYNVYLPLFCDVDLQSVLNLLNLTIIRNGDIKESLLSGIACY